MHVKKKGDGRVLLVLFATVLLAVAAALVCSRYLLTRWVATLGMGMDQLVGDPVFMALERGKHNAFKGVCLQLCARVHAMHIRRGLLQVPEKLHFVRYLFDGSRRCGAVLRDASTDFVVFRCAVHCDELLQYVNARENEHGCHSGVWNRCTMLSAQVRDGLRESVPLVVTGYSMGAAWATLLAAMLAPRRLSLVLFASPPVVTRDAARRLHAHATVSNMMHRDDYICKLGLGRYVQVAPVTVITTREPGVSPHSYASFAHHLTT
jgi:hypothetical protein